MIKRCAHVQRGAALPETILTIGFTLLMLFAAVRLAMLGFYQLMTDGSAFTAAHIAAVNTTTSNVALATTAIFPKVVAADLNLTLVGTSSAQAIITKTTAGLPLLPGTPATFSVSGQAIEPQTSPAAKLAAAYAFSATAILKNYCPPPGNPQGVNCTAPYALHLAQKVDTNGNGSGTSSPFAEWFCHAAVFASLNFPATRPAAGSAWDPSRSTSPEYPIYQWDSGAAC